MSTATETRVPGRSTVLFSQGDIASGLKPTFTFKKGDTGASVLTVDNIAVFRSGTFRDSMGFQMTWEGIHLDQMLAHYEMLRDRGIFADVPVRDGHPGFLISNMEGNGKVVGWHTGLRKEKLVSSHDGQEYEFLIATYDILDPEAQQAIQSGLWRNRSAEVGRYVTNDEAEFWPVYQGVAYVDIPAVEGLNSFSKQHNIAVMMEEDGMTGTTSTATTPEVPTPPAVPQPPVAQQHAAPTQQGFLFNLGGQQTTDFTAVQNYINEVTTEVTTLRAFRDETVEANRVSYVKGLVKDNKLLASQEEATVAFAKGLSAEQFDAWKATQDAAPVQPVLGVYGAPQPTGAQPVGGTVDATATEIETLKGVVRQHQRSSLPVEQIKATKSYKRLVSLDPTFSL